MPTRPVSTTDDQFDAEVLQSELPVLVDFWAPWCGPCQVVGPILEELAHDLAGKLRVVKVNTDESPLGAIRYGVRGIPTLVLFRDGREVDRVVGAAPKRALRSWLESHLPAPAAAPSV